MKFVIRLKAQFSTNEYFGFDTSKCSKIKGDGDFYSVDTFIIGNDLFMCRTEAVRIIRDILKAITCDDENISNDIKDYLRAAIKSIQLEQKCNLTMQGDYQGTEISYVQIAADDVMTLDP